MKRQFRLAVTCGLLAASTSLAIPADAAERTAAFSSAKDEFAATADQTFQGNPSFDGNCQCDGGGQSWQPWNFTLTQTVDFATNLALPLALTPANVLGQFEDDFQFQTNATLARSLQLNNGGTLTAGVGYYQNLHPSVQQLDLNAPSASLAYTEQLGERLYGTLDYEYAYYFLQGESFVSQNRTGLTLLYRANEQWDYQGRFEYLNSDFRPSPFLDSDNYFGRLEAIRFLEARDDFLSFGYTTGYSDAVSRAFSYQVQGLFVGGRWLFGESNINELKLTFTYGVYDFFALDPLEPVFRQDEIFTAQTYLARKLADRWVGFVQYTFLNSESNATRQDYDSNVISLGLTYTR